MMSNHPRTTRTHQFGLTCFDGIVYRERVSTETGLASPSVRAEGSKVWAFLLITRRPNLDVSARDDGRSRPASIATAVDDVTA